MKIVFSLLSILVLIGCKQQVKPKFASTRLFHLNTPQINASKTLFQNTTEITMQFSMPGATIKYSVDGTEVTKQSLNYNKPIFLKKSTIIKAKSYHPDYQESPTNKIQITRIKENISDSKISISPKPNTKYKGKGAKILIDLKKGTLQFSSAAWLGFQEPKVTTDITFSEPKKVSKIRLSTLLNHGSWIFLPSAVTVISNNKIVGELDLKKPSKNELPALHYIEIPVDSKKYTDLKIIVTPLHSIPNWHMGKNTPAWFFMDEILIE